jgi:hypothetical protein
MDEDSLKEK